METNEGHGKLRPCGSNTELEKFKRRLIRAVARMLLYEKRNEDEVWAGLRKETGCDCKELWNRMRALTIKKLNRLLQVEDRADLLPKPARMSITDWLMFDTVLVHEDFDVTGMKESTKEDKKILVDLFDLVEKHTIEFLAGDDLAEAWLKLTLEYNSESRQCTPMLLQRRWYQLKLATRARFYKYWSVYKGIVKRIHFAEPFKPTPLQATIAFRYKPLVVKPFMLWEDLIKNTLVVLPEAFERQEKFRSAKNDDIESDVMCIEPVVETIDLDADSNSDEELEYRKTSQSNDQALLPVKQEPRDKYEENTPSENRQDKILHFAEAVMEATANELDEIEINDDIASFESPNSEVETDKNDEFVVTENTRRENLSETSSDLVIENETKAKELEPILPQITNVFGGVDVSNENLSKISLMTAQISKIPSKATLESEEASTPPTPLYDDSDDLMIIDDAKTKVGEVSIKEESTSLKPDSKLNTNGDTTIDLTKRNWFGDLSNDIDFGDDGIQLIDDGIAYVDDESSYEMPEIKTEIKSIIEIEEDSIPEIVEEDEPTVDEKLLMVPVVNVVKLDDLGILPVALINHVVSKSLIDFITEKTKPFKKEVNLCRPIKKEINVLPIKREADESESKDDDGIENIKKVKLSSSLLQKPRCRTYNPIQLCKNPDFNTRLKKLNVGFFSSPRNRLLLKACKPLSIDVSKAFEYKLVKGTMYLEINDNESLYKQLEPEENNQNVSVVPSAMAVQSLIDNTRNDILTMSYSPIAQKPVQSNPITCVRNRIINLPDITVIRKINQQLLTAEVTPLQGKSISNQVPVTLVNANNPKNINTTSNKAIAGPASRTKLMRPQVVDITKVDNVGKDESQTRNVAGNKDGTKSTYKPHTPWKPRLKTEVPWYSTRNSMYAEDTLLALDSLNKMLYLTINTTETTLNMPQGKPSKTKKKKSSQNETISVKSSFNDDNSNDDVQVVSETKLDNAEAKKCRKGKTLQSKADSKEKLRYCCWARERICQLLFSKKKITKHNCPFPLCLCCCRNALVEFIRRKKEVVKPKVPTGILPLGFADSEYDDDTENITSVEGNTKKSAVVAEVMPTEEKTAEMPTSDYLNKEDEDIKINTIENDVNKDTLVSEHETNQEEVTQIEDDNTCDVTIGAEISVITSESPVTSDDSKTITATTTNTIPPVKPKPKIRVKPRHPFKKGTEKSLVKQIFHEKYNQVKDSSRPLILTQNLNVVENESADDPTNVSKIQEEMHSEPIKPPSPRHKNTRSDIPPLYFTPIAQKPVQSDPITSPSNSAMETIAMPKTYTNQKMIYLNSKQISELPSDNPIFLGKNKILLTTAIFPPNFKAFEAFQANIKQTLALPKGIQLLLLPSGRLTYVRDCKIDVSEEFMTSLPLLISAIQNQINGSISQPIATNSQTEVIDLSADEATNIKENTEQQSEVTVSEDIDQTKSGQELRTEDTEKIISGDIPIVNLEDIKTVESGEEVNTSININASESEPIEDKENSGKLKNILSDLMAMSGIEQTDVTSTPKDDSSPEDTSIPNVVLSPVVASTSKEVISPVITVEPLNMGAAEAPGGNENNDCEEIQPIQHSMNPPLLQPINSKVSQHSPVQVVHTPKDDDSVKNMEPRLKKVFSSSLTPITSLSELKYACAQSGLFFKLDLETGLLVPINVCMKKLTDANQRKQNQMRKLSNMQQRSSNSLVPKSIIDLTDDDGSEVTVVESNLSESQSIEVLDENGGHIVQGTVYVDKATSSSNPKCEVVSGRLVNTKKNCCTVDQRIIGNNVNRDGEVKPLKLFKSPTVLPSILERRLKKVQKRIIEERSAVDYERRRLKRKQEFERLTRVDVSNNMGKKLHSDDSSDDEPLAKIATKMRNTEIEINQQSERVIREEEETSLPSNSKFIRGVESVDKLPIAIDGPMNDESDLPMEETEDISMEYLDENLLDEDTQEGDCILGV